MARIATLLMLLAVPAIATAQDSLMVSRLEQDVRQLQGQVATLTQLVNQLRMRADNPSVQPPGPMPPRIAVPVPQQRADDVPRWVSASRWRALANGMNELEVIESLGPPTSTRINGDDRVLLYALEIGPASFLSGSVTLRERTVVAVETPVLK